MKKMLKRTLVAICSIAMVACQTPAIRTGSKAPSGETTLRFLYVDHARGGSDEANKALADGSAAFRRGDCDKAITHWHKAAAYGVGMSSVTNLAIVDLYGCATVRPRPSTGVARLELRLITSNDPVAMYTLGNAYLEGIASSETPRLGLELVRYSIPLGKQSGISERSLKAMLARLRGYDAKLAEQAEQALNRGGDPELASWLEGYRQGIRDRNKLVVSKVQPTRKPVYYYSLISATPAVSGALSSIYADFARDNDCAKAMAAWRQYPNEPAAQTNLGLVLFLGCNGVPADKATGLAYLRKAASSSPPDPLALFNLADAYLSGRLAVSGDDKWLATSLLLEADRVAAERRVTGTMRERTQKLLAEIDPRAASVPPMITAEVGEKQAAAATRAQAVNQASSASSNSASLSELGAALGTVAAIALIVLGARAAAKRGGSGYVPTVESSYGGNASGCTCSCVNGELVPLCSSTTQVTPVCAPRVCPVAPPSVEPIMAPKLSPLGTTGCSMAQVLNEQTRSYEWQRVCR